MSLCTFSDSPNVAAYCVKLAVMAVTLAEILLGSLASTSSFWSDVTVEPNGAVSKSVQPAKSAADRAGKAYLYNLFIRVLFCC